MLKTHTRQANWRRANPAKYDAHLAVQRAVKAGDLEDMFPIRHRDNRTGETD